MATRSASPPRSTAVVPASALTIVVDIGAHRVRWGRASEVKLRACVPTPSGLTAQLIRCNDVVALETHLVPVLSMILQREGLLAYLPLPTANSITDVASPTTSASREIAAALSPQVVLLADRNSNRHVTSITRNFFENATAARFSVLSPAAAMLAACGLTSGIVVDVGYTSTRCTCVIAGIPVENAVVMSSSPRGARTTLQVIKGLIATKVPEKARKYITDNVAEIALASCATVAPPAWDDAAREWREQMLDCASPVAVRHDVITVRASHAFEHLFDATLDEEDVGGSATDAAATVESPTKAASAPPEVLRGFSIQKVVTDALVALDPVSQGIPVLESIVVTGGLSEIPNLTTRVIEEVIHRLDTAPSCATVKAHLLPLLRVAVVGSTKPYAAGCAAATIGAGVLLQADAAVAAATSQHGGKTNMSPRRF